MQKVVREYFSTLVRLILYIILLYGLLPGRLSPW